MWTPVPKPTGANWSDVAKPAESSVVTFANDAQPFGLLIAITRDTTVSSITSGWQDIAKPAVANWTSVIKPTS